MRIFIGVDERQPLAYTVLQSSIIRHASRPVAITPLLLSQLPISRRGLTDFTFSRYLVPFLSGYQGISLFLDADMIVRCDIHELFGLADENAVKVVKKKERFEWPALMLFNNSLCTELTPELIEKGQPQNFGWGDVGELPDEYHHLVGYDEPNPDAKIVHYTMGIPEFPEVAGCEFEREWHLEKQIALRSPSWFALMGKSKHAAKVLEKFQ